MSLRDICFISIFAAITAVCAQIGIPMPIGVPFTLQTFAVPLAGVVLGAKKGALSSVVYVALGMIGIPVFSGFSGGIAVIFGKTGGYIVSFPILALLAGIGSDLYEKVEGAWKKNLVLYAGIVLGIAANFASGMYVGKIILSCSLAQAFALFALPYLPTSAIKIVLAGVVGTKAKKLLFRSSPIHRPR